MKFSDYIGIDAATFGEQYINTGLVDVAHHEKFPLSIYTYGRRTVHGDVWDHVTTKCRGIIVNRETGEIVARPFEKFHNYGSSQAEREHPTGYLHLMKTSPVIWEKMDGFLVTIYSWDGIPYAASKGSFHSIHAKWATSEIRRYRVGLLPQGWTLVCEGLHPDLRIVVDYGKRKELVPLALVNNETGEEMLPQKMGSLLVPMGFTLPRSWDMRLDEAVSRSRDDRKTGEEGYVATWYRDGQTPYRLKIKMIDYLRLHRIVCGVSPKRIWEALANGWQSEIDEYVNNSPEWFARFAKKWVRAVTTQFDAMKSQADSIYRTIWKRMEGRTWSNLGECRKAWALAIQEHPQALQSILFAMLDNKPVDQVVWKKLRDMTKGVKPLVDAHNS